MTNTNLNHVARRHFVTATVGLSMPFMAACHNDSPTPAETALAPSGTSTGAQPDSTRNNSGNAIAGIRISPQQLTLQINGSATVAVLPIDASGNPSLALLANRPVLTVGHTAIASVNSADNSVRGISGGTTKLIAAYGALKDSIIITVTSGRDTTTAGGGNPTTPTPTAPVSVFTLTAYVFGRTLAGTTRDTSNVVSLAGASISIYRLSQNPAVPADTLGIRTLVKTVVADANGKAVVPDLASGYYSIAATANYQGAAMEGRLEFGPPRQSDFVTSIYLNRK